MTLDSEKSILSCVSATRVSRNNLRIVNDPTETRMLHRIAPFSRAEKWLNARWANSAARPLYIANPTQVAFTPESTNLDSQPFVIDLKPQQNRKVTGDGKWEYGRAEILATELWPIAVFWALTGGQASQLSLDTGVCVHPVPNPINPEGEPALVVTLMASWDHHWFGKGTIWDVSRDDHRFEQVSNVPWLYSATTTVTVPRILGTPVTSADLPFKPVECRPDHVMLEVGAEPLSRRLPKRGPHATAFDPEYGCGHSGGTFMVIGRDIYAIGDSFLPVDKRVPQSNVRTIDDLVPLGNPCTPAAPVPSYELGPELTLTP